MTDNTDTTPELKMGLIDHIASILDDLEMTDDKWSDQAIAEMHDRNVDLAGFLVGSLGLSDATKDTNGYLVRVNPEDPHSYVDKQLG